MQKLLNILISAGLIGSVATTNLLSDEIEMLKQRIELLEAEQKRQKEAHKGGLELSSDATVLNVGGRLKLDMIYGWPQGSVNPGDIDVSESGSQGHFRMSARDSRLWIGTRTLTEVGTVRSLLEVDFQGSDGEEVNENRHGVGLLHALIEVNGLLVGQTNSLFNTYITPDTIMAVINESQVRQAQIRYSNDAGSWGYDISLENPETTLMNSSGLITSYETDKVPDLGLRLRYYPDWGEAAIAGMVRYLNADSNGVNDSAVGWGVNGSARIKLGIDDIRLDAQYGNGIGRYFAYDMSAAGRVDANGQIELQSVYGVQVAYFHRWSSRWSSTLSVAVAGADNDDGVGTLPADDVVKQATSANLNLFWYPFENMLSGLEYCRADKKLENGAEGDIEVVQAMLQFDF